MNCGVGHKKSLGAGIAAVRDRLKVDHEGRPGLLVSARCEYLIRELLSYQREHVLLVRSGNKLEAIEIEHFSPRSEGSNRPKGSYYRGMSQAISLTRTGVDYVSLHHYFDREIRALDVTTYGKTVHDLRNRHDLPFDYRCLRLTEDEFSPVQIHPQKARPDELRERDSGIDFRAGYPNPLLQDPVKKDAERARQHLKRMLKIPD